MGTNPMFQNGYQLLLWSVKAIHVVATSFFFKSLQIVKCLSWCMGIIASPYTQVSKLL